MSTSPVARPTAVIRAAEPRDIPPIQRLLDKAFQVHEPEMGTTLFGHYRAELVATTDRMGATLIVAYGDTIVGTARVDAPDPAAPTLPRNTAWVRAVAVDPDLQGMGLAHELMDACARHARLAGATLLMLRTTEFMRRAVGMYARLGYERAPAWDLRADEHYPLAEPSSVVALAYILDLNRVELPDVGTTRDFARPKSTGRAHILQK